MKWVTKCESSVSFSPAANKNIDNCVEEMLQHQYHQDSILAEIKHKDREPTLFRMKDIPVLEKLEKFMEDVRQVLGTFLSCYSCKWKFSTNNTKDSIMNFWMMGRTIFPRI